MEKSYKEKYEQAIERLKQWGREHPCGGYVLSDRDKFIFPELKESWDEKMRKAIKEALSSKQAEDIIESKYKIKMVDVSDWLEKQCQVNESAISQHEIETCKENDNSLTHEDERIRKEIINYFQCQSEEEPTRKEIHNKWIAWLENIPVTIDHEKREGFHLGYKACREEQGEQNLAENAKPQSSTPMSYGKELEKRMCDACNRFYAPNTDSNRYSASDLFYAGVKAERDLNTLAWSEEDEQHVDSLLKRLDALCRNKFERTRFAISEDRDWLKSLRPQPQWKPSDEHISLLQAIINDPNNASSESCQIVLKDILEQLKKLKEE